MPVDHSAATDQLGDFDEVTLEAKLKAQRVVAGFPGIDAVDCADILKALGIHPKQLEEAECPVLLVPPPRPLPAKR